MNKKIVIAHGHTSIEILHTITPFVLASKKDSNYKIKFINYKFKNIFRQQGDLLILIRKYHDGKLPDKKIITELKKLRKNFTKIVYFDDSAAASIVIFCTFPYIDEYWKRACLKDKQNYKEKLYGGHIYSNFYSNKFKINDDADYFINPVADNDTQFDKLKIAWNIGVGIYPLNKDSITDQNYLRVRKYLTGLSIVSGVGVLNNFFERNMHRVIRELKMESSLKKRNFKISSRFSDLSYRKSVGYQRKICIDMTKNNKFFLSGYLKKKEFTNEIFNVLGVLSPFGWGEVCYRDFEAIIAGAYLIKPNMSHLDTWPNVYKRDYYFSLDWDLSDINKMEKIIDNIDKCEISVNAVREYYRSCLQDIVPRCLKMIDNLFL